VSAEKPVDLTLSLRRPAWLSAPMRVWIGLEPVDVGTGPGYGRLKRVWRGETVYVELPTALRAEPLPDEPETVGFMVGPVVLAGLCDCERALVGDPVRPTDLLRPNADGGGYPWGHGFRTVDQPVGLRFVPLYSVVDEPYSIYFPVIER
jgi:hypothetical protein